MAIIYKIESKKTGKVYIGHTTMTLTERMYAHRDRLKRGVHPSLQSAYNADGWKSFEVSALETVDDALARHREQYWIEYYGITMRCDLYNIWSAVSSDHKKPAKGYRDRMKNRIKRVRVSSSI